MRAEDEKTIASLLLALGVILALFFPSISNFFAPYLLPSLFFVMVFSLLPFARVDGNDLLRLHPTVLVLVVWQQFIVPGLTLIVGRSLGLDQQILYFILLTVTSGSLFASPTLVQLMGLEQKMAVQTVIVSTLAAPLSIYLIFGFAQQNGVALDFGLFGLRLLVFLVVPIAIFFAVRTAVNRWRVISHDRLDSVGRWGSVLALIVFCFALEAQVTDAIQITPALVGFYLVIAIGVATIVGISTRIVMAQFGVKAASTAMVLASFRNVGLNFGLVGHIAGPQLAIYVGVCQIPMFFSPLLFDLFFGRNRHEENSDEPQISKKIDGAATPPMRPDGAPSYRLRTDMMTNSNSPAAATAARALNDLAQPMRVSTTPAAHASLPADFYSSSAAYDLNSYAEPAISEEAVAVQETAPVIEEAPADPLPDMPEQPQTHARALMAKLSDELGGKEVEGPRVSLLAGRSGGAVNLALVALFAIFGMAAVWQGNKYFAPYLYDVSQIEKIAAAHTEGRNFAVHDLNIDIRNLRNETIARMEKIPEVIVLGASHWQEAHASLMEGRDFYNSHVHRDYYEDMLGVTEMWVSHNKLPKEVIIAVRDNLLTPVADRTDFLWLPGLPYYRRFADRIGLEPHSRWETLPVQAWREQLSMTNMLAAARTELNAPTPTGPYDQRHFKSLDTLLPGGSILWSADHRELFSRQRADAEALKFAEQRRNDPPKIDPKGIVHLEALFEYLIGNGVKITFAQPPFNPVFWDAVQDSPYREGLQRIEDLTILWSNRYGIPIIGGFDPASVGCTADMYIDAEHSNPNCLKMLLNQYGRTDMDIEQLLGFSSNLRTTI